MLQSFILLFILALMNPQELVWRSVWAQDEIFFKKVQKVKEVKTQKKLKEQKDLKWHVRSPRYRIDFDENGYEDYFLIEKRDALDFITFYNHNHKKMGEFKLIPRGIKSYLYKIRYKRISSKTKVLVLYYYEGVSKYVNFISSIRNYFITIDHNDLKTLSLYKGPVIWEEAREFRDHYHIRKYDLDFKDINQDGILEISYNFKDLKKVYVYRGQGRWKGVR